MAGSREGIKCRGRRVELILGDALTSLRNLPDKSVQCCVTSPPYYGLRDYQTGKWEGGDPSCDHKGEPFRTKARLNANWGAGFKDVKNAEGCQPFKSICGKCGAKRIDEQIGLEETPQQFVEKLVAVFEEVRRVLADDGTLWLNLGDSYANDAKGPNGSKSSKLEGNGNIETPPKKSRGGDVKKKDLLGIPWSVAFALRDAGWWLRQDIIWRKPNPMPESVTDRCVKSHEYVFLLSKSQAYYFDYQAIKEPAVYAGKGRGGSKQRYEQNAAGMDNKQFATRNKRGVRGVEDHQQLLQWLGENDPALLAKFLAESESRGSVWDVTPATYKGAHFATFPEELIRPCIKAGSRVGDRVLDPFAGTGTTAAVAAQEGRDAILCELSGDYCGLIRERLRKLNEGAQ